MKSVKTMNWSKNNCMELSHPKKHDFESKSKPRTENVKTKISSSIIVLCLSATFELMATTIYSNQITKITNQIQNKQNITNSKYE